jgi:DNA-binding MarR family transcriptional regulator
VGILVRLPRKPHENRSNCRAQLLPLATIVAMETMSGQSLAPVAKNVADLTFKLLANCQEKEERLAAQFKISVPEFRCLRAFRGEKEALVSSLIHELHLSASRVTRILEGLEENGFLERSINVSDRRNILATLTRKGWKLSSELESRYVEMHEEILRDIPEELHESVVISLENLLSSLTRWLKGS